MDKDEMVRCWCRNACNGHPYEPGGFVLAIANATLRADDDNFRILQPALLQIIEKYPIYLKEHPDEPQL